MKFFNRKKATAFLLASAMLMTSVSSVFAEGSREMNKVPADGTQPVAGSTDAYRPYLDWRDRDQFGMASKNVVHVYAKKGETVFFGSDVTNASDKSIQAVVHKESMYRDAYGNGGDIEESLDLDGNDLQGCSIAVTLPVAEGSTEAFNPEQEKAYFDSVTVQSYAEGIFKAGSALVDGADPTKVYLFDVVEGGAGHIANPTMEENGPNGVNGTTNGYEPLKFVAPYTGTYAFRFLSREYSNSDKRINPTMNPAIVESKVIDFDGWDEYQAAYPDEGQYKTTTQYYEESYGDWIELKAGTDDKERTFNIKNSTGTITIPETDYAELTTNVINNYMEVANGTSKVACIEFTPKHDGAVLEFIWETTDATNTDKRTINVQQGDLKSSLSYTPKANEGLIVTTITGVDGTPIKAGEPLTIWFGGNTYKANVYEIRYYHHRANAGIDGAVAPTTTPEPTATPVPQKVELINKFADYTTRQEITVSDDLYKVYMPISTKGNSTYSYKYITANASYNDKTYSNCLACWGNKSSNGGGSIQLTSYKDNAWFEFVVQNQGEKDTHTNSSVNIKDAEGNVLWTSSTEKEYGTFTTKILNTNETLTIYPDQNHLRIYEINYYYIDETATTSEVMSLSEATTTESVSISSFFVEDNSKIIAGTKLLDSDTITVETWGSDVAVVHDGYSEHTSKYRFNLRLTNEYDGTLETADAYSECAALLMTPKVDGTFAVDIRIAENKTMKISDGSNVVTSYTGADDGDSNKATVYYETITAELTAGKTYCLYERGGTGQVYGFTFTTASNTDEDTQISTDWTAIGTTTVTESDGVYTITQPAGEAAAPVSYDLLSIMENAPTDITTADGTITVSYDLLRPSAYKGSSNWFIDISTNTNVSGWTGGNAGTFGRLSGYGAYDDDMKFVPGTGATNGTIYDFANATDDKWQTVTFTIDLGSNAIMASMDGDSSVSMSDSYPTGIANALYLNAEPCDSVTENGDVLLKIKNITASYTAAEEDTPAPTSDNLTPVSNQYIWDFYDVEGTNDGSVVNYTTDTILGNHELVNGVDVDGSYPYDILAHVTDDGQIGVKPGMIFLQTGAEFASDNTPESGVLELIPNWDGKINVSFEYGGIEIYQPGNTTLEKASNTSSSAGEYKSVSLEVEALKPVYIYLKGGMTYVRGITYIPEEPDSEKRKVDEKWAVTGSEVAAWDITVTQGGGYTIEGNNYAWDIPNDFYANAESEGLELVGEHQDISQSINYNGETVAGLKMGAIKNNNMSNYFSYTPLASGQLNVYGYSGNADTLVKITQNGAEILSQAFSTAYAMQEFTVDVLAGEEVKIYSTPGGTESGTWFCYNITFVEDDNVTSANEYTEVPGRVWTDIFFINAGSYKASIYPQLNVLTENGFLYDFRLNGTQPFSFVFYSNNRGFLLDRWAMYSKPEETGTSGTMDLLQSLEHSFYGKGNADVGEAPDKKELQSDGTQIEYNGNMMHSPVLGNYIPTDSEKDSTHKLFVNYPDHASFEAYTTSKGLRVITENAALYQDILKNVEYVGLGNAASGAVGTIAVGGEFHATITPDIAARLKALGTDQIAIVLDFSSYALTGTPPVPVKNADDTWSKTATGTDAEKNNLVTLSMVVDTDATSTVVYKLSWDGRDAYGNIVPVGTYSDIITSVIEMGTAHFPILDSEHNPNGFKLKMINPGNTTADYIYYNNEAVSPKTDEDDPSAWYFTGMDAFVVDYEDENKADILDPQSYPYMIGDGLNRTAGVSSGLATEGDTSQGVMPFGDYDTTLEGDTYDNVVAAVGSADRGYGNYAAIDMWSRYKLETDSKIELGVAKLEDLKPYVSFVAIDGKTSNAYPFKVSHVGHNYKMLAEYEDHLGDSIATVGQKFGNTISTGFVTTLSSAAGISNDQVVWDITIPVSGSFDDNGTTTTAPTFIKVTDDTALTTQEDIDEAEYLAYEMYAGLFSEYGIDDENSVGEEEDPSWDADSSLNEDGDVGIVDTATGVSPEEVSVAEESYIEDISLLSETAGDYDASGYWDVKFNVNTTPTLVDEVNTINHGDIYQVEQIGGTDSGKANIKLRYNLPTTITGQSIVTVGLIIDNLYAPGAIATAKLGGNELDAYHDVTTYLVSESNMVSASSFDDYATNSNNEYYTGDRISATDAIKNFDLKMDFRGDDTSVTVDGVEITKTSANYSLFDGAVVLKNSKYHNGHGITVQDVVSIQVPGAADITIGTCSFSNVKAVLRDASGNVVASQELIGSRTGATGTFGCYSNNEANNTAVLSYTGNTAATLTLSFESTSTGGPTLYLPYLRVTSK